MPPSLKIRTFGAFLLAVALALPAAEAAPRRAAADRTITSALWSLVSAAWTKAGCILDPNGCAGEATPSDFNKEGCILDPNGAAGPTCATPPATTGAGCILDPDGSCVASPETPVRD